MTMNGFLSPQSMDDFNKSYREGPVSPSLDGALGMPIGDVLSAQELMTSIRQGVQSKLSSSRAIESVQYETFLKELNDIFSALEIRSAALDKIFNPPPREDDSTTRNGPSICVYNNASELEFVNGTYLKLVGLSSAEEAKALVRDKALVERIYTPEIAKEVYQFVSTIETNGGYAGKVFPLANGNAARWTSLYNKASGGNVRVAEDVTNIANIPPLLSTEGVNDIPFRFRELTEHFGNLVKGIITPGTEEEILLTYLKDIASIGDIIVDQGPFLIVIKKGDEFISVNKNYVAATGYSLKELQTEAPVLYFASQEEQVKVRLASLQNVPHYNDSFKLRRNDGTSLEISWDTFRIDGGNDNAITTVRVGSMIDSAEAIAAMEWLKQQNEKS